MLIINNEKLLDFLQFTYTLQEIKIISEFLEDQNTFNFPCLESGLFSAATLTEDAEYTGYTSVWVRDNIHVAHSHYVLGNFAIASRNAQALMNYFHKYKHRFEKIIDAGTVPENVMERPHIRFDGVTLTEIDQQWAHAQNDALGYFLWFYCKLIIDGKITPKPEDLKTLALFPLYFQTIAYWQDEDSGHWEEIRKIAASSMGVVVAALTSLKEMLIAQPNLAENLSYQEQTITINFVDQLLQKGNQELDKILPFECIQAGEKRREYDGALLFLIYPLKVVNENQSEHIIQNVSNNLQGNYGIKRYLKDSFWAADYKEKLDPEARTVDFSEDMSFRDSLIQENQEAQWCIFDPILSIIFGLKFQETHQEKYLEQQTWYLNRSLGQLTSKDCPAGELKCPELYYLEKGQYVPNDVVPLLWTQANLSMALKFMEDSLKL
ncbi:MAG TPA: phosphorylase kinase [Cyanothece sp. UBA12306]|nr:phosphorylase kinase [Cyanothece sp. UBA12306]